MSKYANEAAALTRDQKIIAGVDKYFAAITTLMVAGTSYTPASLKAVFQAHIDALKAIAAARSALAQLVAANRKSGVQTHDLVVALRMYVLGNYGPLAVQMLNDFGMKVPTPRATTVKTKAEAQVKAEATRKARHTLGSKQKAAIKGQPEVVTPKPTT